LRNSPAGPYSSGAYAAGLSWSGTSL
jgi:hypothetical protein